MSEIDPRSSKPFSKPLSGPSTEPLSGPSTEPLSRPLSRPLPLHEQSTDAELFAGIQNQAMEALGLLYDRYSRLVYTVAVHILNQQEAAEDITQETFLKLWQRSEIYQPQRGSLSGFLVMASRSRAIERLRASGARTQPFPSSFSPKRKRVHRWGPSLSTPVPEHNPPLESTALEQRSRQVYSALQQLSESERHLIHSAYYGGLSQPDIARQTDLALDTVQLRSRRALKTLRAVLHPIP